MPVIILLIFFVYKISLSFEIITNYPLPKNNIREVYEKTENRKLIIDLLKRTGDFEEIYFRDDALYLTRKPYLKKVVISGKYSFWKKEIKAVAGLVEGFPIDIQSIHNIPVRLKQFYMDRGYPYAKIDVHFHINGNGEGILYLNIDEGNFYKIKKVNIFYRESVPEDLKKEILNILDLEGEDFSLNRIQEKIDSVEQFLTKNNYYDALVNILSMKPEDGHVTLNILVDTGYRYRIVFEGNRYIPASKLKKVLTFYDEGVNFYQIGVSVENLENLYRNSGFLDVEIIPQFKEDVQNKESLIKFIIDEGKRYLIEYIDLETDIEDLKKILGKYIGLPYRREEIKKFLISYVEKYYREGYLNYSLNIEEVLNKEEKTVYLQISVFKGKPYILSHFKVDGYNWRGEIPEIPSPYDPEKVISIMDKINKTLKDQGYIDVNTELDAQFEELDRVVKVSVKITVLPGKPYINKTAFIYGTKHLELSAVKRNLSYKKIFTVEEFDNELDFLYRTYLFSSITPYYNVNRQEKYVTKAFILREEKRGLFQGILGYNTDQKLKVATSVILKNLFNYGFETSAYVEKSDIRTNYSVSFGSRILPRRTSGFITFLKSYQYHRLYDLNTEGLQIQVSRRNNKWVQNSFYIERMYNRLLNQDVYHKNSYSTLKLGYRLLDDHRKPKQNPQSGYILSLGIIKEMLDVEHAQFTTSFRYYKPFYFFILTQKVSFGYIAKRLGKLPISERLFLGGLGNFRGFGYEEVAGELNEGGKSMFLINNDIRFPVFQPFNLHGFVFFDAGNVYENDKKLRKLYLRKTAGIGVYVPTPVGSFIFDIAYKLDKKAGEYPYRIEFSIGIQF
ncbi:BamA/OMP85 family outer membrane protein [Persephonella sp.]